MCENLKQGGGDWWRITKLTLDRVTALILLQIQIEEQVKLCDFTKNKWGK